ncbi:MAG: J domain-containing protein [Patescibacteria group bacterium]|nr:J domain-containing protein [Patescibacteria group bacterium]
MQQPLIKLIKYKDLFEVEMEDYYHILGINQEADLKEIRKAYLKKIKEIHPDRSDRLDTDKETVLLNEAYNTLKNKREEYDKSLNLTGEKIFYNAATSYYTPSLYNEIKSETKYKRLIIFLWVILGFILALTVSTYLSLRNIESTNIQENGIFPEEIRPREQKNFNVFPPKQENEVLREI